MGAKLLYRDEKGAEASAELSPAGAFIGRSVDCIVRTEDALVSRHNCRIFVENKRWAVEDQKSSNGTFVNNVRVQKRLLVHGDIIRCGSLQVCFAEEADAVTAEPARSVDDGKLLGERDALLAQVKSLQAEVDKLKSRVETSDEELRKARTELGAAREQLGGLSRDLAQTAEELHAQTHVAEELRIELQALKKEHQEVALRSDELEEDLKTRDRQLERALEDVQRTKKGADELRTQMAEVERTKDEGWRELNNRTSELDHLRSVISEQERMLEERRVGLMALENATKELRAENELKLRELVTLRNERGNSTDNLARKELIVEGLQEENRRLTHLIAQIEGGGGSSLVSEEQLKLSKEFRELKVDMKRAESESTRLKAEIERIASERAELESKIASLEVERSHAMEEMRTAQTAQQRAEDSRGKAELLRQRIEEERNAATQARDAALSSVDQYRLELDREKKAPKRETTQNKRAADAYQVVNDALSKIRTEIEKLSESSIVQLDGELRETVASSVERLEEAKGTLRALREVIDG